MRYRCSGKISTALQRIELTSCLQHFWLRNPLTEITSDWSQGSCQVCLISSDCFFTIRWNKFETATCPDPVIFLYILSPCSIDRAIAQAVSHWLLISERKSCLRPGQSACDCGDKVALVSNFLRHSPLYPVSIIIPLFHLTRISWQLDKRPVRGDSCLAPS
jgi:hypothetical protein